MLNDTENQRLSLADSRSDDVVTVFIMRSLRAVIARRWLNIGAVFLGLVVGCAYVIVGAHFYVASMEIGPPLNAPRGGESVSAGMELLLSRGNDAAPEFQRFLEVLHSRELALRLTQKYQLLQKLFPKRWDAATGRWLPPGGLRATIGGFVRKALGMRPYPDMDEYFLRAYLLDVIEITPIGRSPFRLVTMRDLERERAVECLKIITREADQIAREQQLSQSGALIENITSNMADVTQFSVRSSLSAVLTESLGKAVLAKSAPTFAFSIVDDVAAPSQAAGPSMLFIPGVGLLVGGLACILTIFLHFRASKGREGAGTAADLRAVG